MNVGGLAVVSDALDVTFDENVARLFACQNVDVVKRHFVRVPDYTAQLVAVFSRYTRSLQPLPLPPTRVHV